VEVNHRHFFGQDGIEGETLMAFSLIRGGATPLQPRC
jgi:hypothetical protein